MKTDRRDAEKLAECYQSGTLTTVWVPDGVHEAMRDLVRQRGAAKADESRAKHRLVKHLLRYGLRHPGGSRAWTHPWWRWVQNLKLEHEAQEIALQDCISEVLHMSERVSRLDASIDRCVEAMDPEKKAVIESLQALRGVAKLTAVTIVSEVGTFRRFRKATEFMGYTGLVPSEYSSGGREAKGRITRTGNAHLRHVLGESAWHARHKPWLNKRLKQVLPHLPSEVAEAAWKAQGTGAPAPKIHEANILSKTSREGGYRCSQRTGRLHLGNRDDDRITLRPSGCLKDFRNRDEGKSEQLRAARKGESSQSRCAV